LATGERLSRWPSSISGCGTTEVAPSARRPHGAHDGSHRMASVWRQQTNALLALQCRLDIDDRSPVDSLDRSYPKPVAIDRTYHNRMKSQRIGTIGRSRRKHACERRGRVRPWMYAKDLTPGFVKPGDDDQFVSNTNILSCFCRPRMQFEPGVRRPLRTLPRSIASTLEAGANHADRSHPIVWTRGICSGLHWITPSAYTRLVHDCYHR
jgi:hypothetical protein